MHDSQRDIGAKRITDESACRVGRDEITFIGDVFHVQRKAPSRRNVSEQRVSNEVGRNRIDIRDVAVGRALVVQPASDHETGHPRNGEFVGGPKVGNISGDTLRMIAYRGNALWVVGDDGVLRRRIGENVPWLQRGGINGNLRPSGALRVEDNCLNAVERHCRRHVVA